MLSTSFAARLVVIHRWHSVTSTNSSSFFSSRAQSNRCFDGCGGNASTISMTDSCEMAEATNETPSSFLSRSCEECKSKQAVYQCPGCELRTCSLECCQSHKKRTACSGKRNRGAFIPLCRMNDNSLRSDYFFLEEVLDQIPRANKMAKMEPSTNYHTVNRNNHRPSAGNSNNACKKTRRLLQQAERRGVDLQIMPTIMERRKKNSSWYCGPRDTITWKVEAILMPSQKKFFFSLSENEDNILQHVSKHMDVNSRNNNPSFLSIPVQEYQCFIKRLPSSANSPHYVQIQPSDSLRNVLKGLTIVEHPTIYCVPAEMTDEFPTGTDKIIEQKGTDHAVIPVAIPALSEKSEDHTEVSV